MDFPSSSSPHLKGRVRGVHGWLTAHRRRRVGEEFEYQPCCIVLCRNCIPSLPLRTIIALPMLLLSNDEAREMAQ